jgi:acyl carrier protein
MFSYESVNSVLLDFAGYSPETWQCGSDEAVNLFYQDLGFVDSLFFLVFLIKIENEFNIKFTNSEIQSDQFRKLSGVTSLVLDKTKKKHE